MQGEAFWGLKSPKNPGASGGRVPGSLSGDPCVGLWTPRRARSALLFGQKRF